MRSTLCILAAIASLVAAQNASPITFADFPKCAVTSSVQAIIATGCGTNVSCVCKTVTFMADVIPAVKAACSPSDLQKAIESAVQLCSEYGDKITIPNLETSPAASTTLETSTPSTLLSDSSSTTTASNEGITSTSPPARAYSTNGVTSTGAISPIATKTALPEGTTRSSAALSAVTAKSASAQSTRPITGLLGFGVLLVALPALAGIA
ncbi:hypothetical protein ACEPPN_006144 [Leptodophora sp. 'Broadleaf-Isolate-01']